MIEITSIPARALTPAHRTRWTALQDANPEFASPCFAPEFTMNLAQFRNDLHVGILRENGEIVGFFPFRKTRYAIGKPLDMCDYDGVICKHGLQWDARSLLRACGLKSWDFGHLLASQTPFARFHRAPAESPLIDISRGYEMYVQENRAGGSEQIKKAGNLERRLEREVGPLRFDAHVSDVSVLRQLIRWADEKRQRQRDGNDWTLDFLEQILARQSDQFAGTLSVLFAGDQLVAAHFGMRSRTVWHYWLPAYNPAFEKYSAGIILLLRMVQIAPSLGIHVIDLGKGNQPYKQRLMNDAIPLVEGFVEVPSLIAAARAVKRRSESLLGESPALLSFARAVFGFAVRGMKLRTCAK